MPIFSAFFRPLPAASAIVAALVLAVTAPRPASAQTWTNGHYVVGDTIVVEPLSLSVVRNSQARAIVVIAPSIEVKDGDALRQIAGTMPRLRDAWLRALGPYSRKIDLTAPIAVDDVAAIMQHEIKAIYGDHDAKVLITFATIRRL